jgi:hypothetical protein
MGGGVRDSGGIIIQRNIVGVVVIVNIIIDVRDLETKTIGKG